MKAKVCIKCKIEKDYSDFPKRNGTKDGLRADCKTCKSLRDKIYYNTPEQKEKIKQQSAEYRKNNICELKKKSAIYRALNREKNIAYSKAYYHKNKVLKNIPVKGRMAVYLDYYKNNKEKVNKRNRDQFNNYIKELSNVYVMQKLKRQSRGVAIEIKETDIELKRSLLKLKRTIKNHGKK